MQAAVFVRRQPANPPTNLIILPRYSFRLNDKGKRQTDNVTCCWIVWREIAMPQLPIRFSASIQFSTQRPSARLPLLDDCDKRLVWRSRVPSMTTEGEEESVKQER
jgi:hypothetical protein